MNWDTIITIIGSGGAGAGIYKVIEYFVVPKAKSKEFDEKLRDELWAQLNTLNGRLDEQNKMLLEVMRENATLKASLDLYKAENTTLKAQLEKHIKAK